MDTAGRAPLRGPHRAQRYPLHLPVRYCRASESQWHVGLTENISDSGAIIRSAAKVALHTRVTIVIALPSSPTTPGGWLIGEGEVVRTADAFSSTTEATFAVTIAEFTLARREDVPDIMAT